MSDSRRLDHQVNHRITQAWTCGTDKPGAPTVPHLKHDSGPTVSPASGQLWNIVSREGEPVATDGKVERLNRAVISEFAFPAQPIADDPGLNESGETVAGQIRSAPFRPVG